MKRKMSIILFLLTILVSCSTPGGLEEVFFNFDWVNIFGNPGPDQVSHFAYTDDGGTIGIGKTYSSENGWDILVIKSDESGQMQWSKTFGGVSDDEGIGVYQSNDGNYVIAANTYSSTIGARESALFLRGVHHGLCDIWIAELDLSGALLWQSYYGGEDEDYVTAIVPHPQNINAFYVLGKTKSIFGDLSSSMSYGDYDAWAFLATRIAPRDILSSGRYGGTDFDCFYDLFPEGDTIHYFIGETASDLPGAGYHPNLSGASTTDFWVAIPEDGVLSNQNGTHYCFGGSENEFFSRGFVEDSGNYVLAGSSFSEDGDISASGNPHRSIEDSDWFLCSLRVLPNASLLWKIRGVDIAGNEKAYGVYPLLKGGYIAGISTYPQNLIEPSVEDYENYFVSISSEGQIKWFKKADLTDTELKALIGFAHMDKAVVYGETLQDAPSPGRSIEDTDWFNALFVPQETVTNDPLMVFIEGGTFQMGDEGGDPYGLPIHTVSLQQDYRIGKFEITFDEYDAYCVATGKELVNDEGWGRSTRPVINVSWFDAIKYCNWLSSQKGVPGAYNEITGAMLDQFGNATTDTTLVAGYRLPTEAEWEFASRGGNESVGYVYSGSDDPNQVGWYWENWGEANTKTQPVGQKKPNELGLYDMSGNVWEWCYDWYDDYPVLAQTNPIGPANGLGRVERSGSWNHDFGHCRVGYRNPGTVTSDPNISTPDRGFRVAQTVF